MGEGGVQADLVAFHQLPPHRPPDVYNKKGATHSDMSGVVITQAVRLILAIKARQGLCQLALRPADRPRVVQGQLHRLYLPPSYVRNG